MNATLELLMSHRSIRKFTDQTIEPELLEQLILAGQAAATSSHIQATTVIRITDREKRAALASVAGGQAYVEQAAEFLVFCADMRRPSQCCEMHGKSAANGMTEHMIIATVDVALFAQNVVIAAESNGLGICYIGALRNNPAKVTELLALPEGVYPVFGLCLGYPDQNPETKPRLPLSLVLKENTYDDSQAPSVLTAYDEEVRDYYRTRTGGNKDTCWSQQMSDTLSKEARPHMAEFLKSQGFMLK